jgi:predicted DNA-binding WGR domain protein
MRFVDTLGRVEKFQQKQKMAQAQAGVLAEKKKKKIEERVAAEKRPRSLKEMLIGMK